MAARPSHGPHGWLCLPAKCFEKTEVQISDCRTIVRSRDDVICIGPADRPFPAEAHVRSGELSSVQRSGNATPRLLHGMTIYDPSRLFLPFS
jgi:hypothetical protein